MYVYTSLFIRIIIYSYIYTIRTGYDISKALCNLDEDSSNSNNSRSKKPVRPPPPPSTPFNQGDLYTSPPSSSSSSVTVTTTGVVEDGGAYSSSSSNSSSASEGVSSITGTVLPQGHMASLGARFMIAQVRETELG